MANTRTLLQLTDSVRIRGGYENSTDITQPLLVEFVNEAIAETYDIVVQKWADYYTKVGTNISVVAGTDSYAVASDFYKLRKVEMLITGDKWRRLYPIDLDVAHRFVSPVSGRGYRYRLVAGNVTLSPMPANAETMRLWYIPFATRLVLDADTFDGINNFEELVIQLAYRRCREREELDTSQIEREIARLVQRVEQASDGRDAEPFYLNPYGPGGFCDADSDWWP